MTSSDLWDAEIAERYDETSAFMFAPEVLDPAINVLADLAGDDPALEFAIGTGRVAVPLAERGVHVSGIELSQPMVDQLHKKRIDIPVVVGEALTDSVSVGEVVRDAFAWLRGARACGRMCRCRLKTGSSDASVGARSGSLGRPQMRQKSLKGAQFSSVTDRMLRTGRSRMDEAQDQVVVSLSSQVEVAASTASGHSRYWVLLAGQLTRKCA